MRSLVVVDGSQAFLDGLADGGANVGSVEALEPNERIILRDLLLRQTAYVQKYANALYSSVAPPTLDAMLSRAQLWGSKGLDGIYNVGLTLGRGNKMMEFVLGPTEHCESCLALAGQVHRALTFLKAGLAPRSDRLNCGGFRCQCELVETTKKASGDLSSVPTKEGVGKGEFLFALPFNV